ncbi:MAG TPA: aminofutalosine synthase MqnE [Thermodesulfobacteriota bacterium]|nr:aminofutalosine synthase MqnE [Thermodesulfobacteriota bacterium]
MLKTRQWERIGEKVEKGESLTREEGIALGEGEDIFFLGELANRVREKKNGNYTYYNINAHLNPSNICVNSCSFCAFSRKPGQNGAYDLSREEIIAQLQKIVTKRTTELHIVGGAHPYHDLRFYTTMLSAIKKLYPEIYLKAFTATEVYQIANVSGIEVKNALKELKSAGLDCMPGGGAEIFSPRVRRKICPQKISGELWREIHRQAHSLGIKTNATMLYGHIETWEERIDHLLSLRQLQEETGGFQAFIPLAYHPQNTSLGGEETSGLLDLKIHAVSRIILNNFDHLKAYWIMTGTEMAQVLQSFGVDDLDGTVTEEKITHAAGAKTPSHLSEDFIRQLIFSAGRIPVERDSLYTVLNGDR